MDLGVRSYNPWQEPCVLVAEQGGNLVECRTCSCYREHVPCAPPPSPIKFTPISCAEPDEACPSTSCALLLVDRKIEAHQARRSPVQFRKRPSPYSPTLLSDSVSGTKAEYSDESMHRMTPLRQLSSASDDDDMTVTSSSCPSSRSSGTNTLVDNLPSDREVDSNSAAIDIHCKHMIATSPHLAAQPSSPKPPTFNLFSLRSSRDAIANAACRFRSSPQSHDASASRPTVSDRQSSSLTSIGSSTVPDTVALPLEYKQSKTKSWPGPSSQLPRPDIACMPQATTRSKSHISDFTSVRCGKRKARCSGVPSCEKCLSRSEKCSINKHSISLQPLGEYARGEETTSRTPPAIFEEERSHFSDYSTDEDDDGEKTSSNVRLVNSIGRLNRRSKTRSSLSNLFSKP